MIKKRNYLKFMQDNVKKLKEGASCANVLVSSIMYHDDKKQWSPDRFICENIGSEPIVVKVQLPYKVRKELENAKKKAKAEVKTEVKEQTVKAEVKEQAIKDQADNDQTVKEQTDGETKDQSEQEEVQEQTFSEMPDTVTIEPKQIFYLSTFNHKIAEGVTAPCIAKVAFRAEWNDWEGGRVQYRIDQATVLKDNLEDIYESHTDRFQLPIMENFGENQKSMSVICPLSKHDNFEEVEIQIDTEDPKTRHGFRYDKNQQPDEEKKKILHIGFNTSDTSTFGMMYLTKPDEQGLKKRVLMTCWYDTKFFNPFGVTQLPSWVKVGHRCFLNGEDMYARGGSKLDNIQQMEVNASMEEQYDDEGNMIHNTTCYLSDLSINMFKTVQKAGIELDHEWCKNFFLGDDTKHEYNEDVSSHPMNKNFMVRFKSGEANMVLNCTEMSGFYLNTFFNTIKKDEFKHRKVTFYGVFEEDSIYEVEGVDARQEKVKTDKLEPALVYCTVENV